MMRPRKRYGYSLLEVMVSLGLFSMLLAASFLPFKIMRDSCKLGGSRADLDADLRVSVQRMLRNLPQAIYVTFSPGSYSDNTPYSRIDFQLPFTYQRMAYYTVQDPSAPAGEMLLMEDRPLATGGSAAGYPRVMARGVTSFYFQPTHGVAPNGLAYAYALVYLCAYPSDAQRPLPDPAKAPVTVATCVSFRNGATQPTPAIWNPILYPQ